MGELSFSDDEIIKLDREQRHSKLNKPFQPQQPDNLIRAINELCDSMSKILIEFRRLNDVLSYLSPSYKQNKTEEKK